jgi:hypothetical protein
MTAENEEAERVPPMWGIWLIDPSGKYGPHKVFAEYGETADDAFNSCAARYRPGGADVTLDPELKPYLINPAREARP